MGVKIGSLVFEGDKGDLMMVNSFYG